MIFFDVTERRNNVVKFSRESSPAHTVRSVSEDGVRVGDASITGTCALTAEQVIENWSEKPVSALDAGDFDSLLEGEPELVLLGTGGTTVFAPRELMFSFARRGIGFEVMDTAAAARTFNVLVGEGRRVAAILYPVD